MKIYKEKAGVISTQSCWVCLDKKGYMYLDNTLHGLLWEVITEWRQDKHIAG
jgi:hypothetical protein|tara:strand:+ start:123 stop:278 length:156 start_codon:yes stop_codon:yes gene_type:complete